MDFYLTKEQQDIQKAAREFAKGEFTDVARELDEKACFDDRLWKKAADLGFLAVFIPETYEGMGMGYLEQCLIVEEFARVDLGITHAIESCFFGSQLIDDLRGAPVDHDTFFIFDYDKASGVISPLFPVSFIERGPVFQAAARVCARWRSLSSTACFLANSP